MGKIDDEGALDNLEFEIAFKEAIVKLSKQLPALIRELQLLRGAIDRMPR